MKGQKGADLVLLTVFHTISPGSLEVLIAVYKQSPHNLLS